MRRLTRNTAAALAVVGVVGLVGARQVLGGSRAARANPDSRQAVLLAQDLQGLRGEGGLLVSTWAVGQDRPSLYNTSLVVGAAQHLGLPAAAPTAAVLTEELEREAASDPLWMTAFACRAAGGPGAEAHVLTPSPLVVDAVTAAAQPDRLAGSGADRTADAVVAAEAARCLGLPQAAALADQVSAATAWTPELLVRASDAGLRHPVSTLDGPATAAAPDCSGWDPVQGPAAIVAEALAGRRPVEQPCLLRRLPQGADAQAVYWQARASRYVPAARQSAEEAVAAWDRHRLAGGLVSTAPRVEPSLRATTTGARLFGLLGASGDEPDWLRTAVRDAAAGPVRDPGDNVVAAVGCATVGLDCPAATAAAKELLDGLDLGRVTDELGAQRWAAASDARTVLGLPALPAPEVALPAQPWSTLSGARLLLARALAESGAPAEAARLGHGAPGDLVQRAQAQLAGGDLTGASAALAAAAALGVDLAPARPALLAAVRQYRAPGSSAMFGPSVGAQPNVQSTYEAYLLLASTGADIGEAL